MQSVAEGKSKDCQQSTATPDKTNDRSIKNLIIINIHIHIRLNDLIQLYMRWLEIQLRTGEF